MFKRLWFCVFLLAAFCSCTEFDPALTEEDISRYVTAIENLAKVSLQIDEEMRNSDAQIVFFCEPCRDLMRRAVQDAGYKSFKSFLLMDLRITYTMRYLLYLRISEMAGEAALDAPVEKICNDPLLRKSLNHEQESKLLEKL